MDTSSTTKLSPTSSQGNNNNNNDDLLLGIDIGTQGLTCLLCRVDNLEVVGKGEGSYGFVPNLPKGHYEQSVQSWSTAIDMAMKQLHELQESGSIQLRNVKSIGISGQMHGQVMCKLATEYYNNDVLFPYEYQKHAVLAPVKLWCDARNQQEATELSQLFGVDLPKRATICRWLWTIRNQPTVASQVNFMTTPAGWLAYLMTQNPSLGIGDASGMFPINANKSYDPDMISKFNIHYTKPSNETATTTASVAAAAASVANTKISNNDDHDRLSASSSPQKRLKTNNIPDIEEILPAPILCGNDSGILTQEAAHWLGLTPGIPVAAAEGDQPAALTGSLIAEAGQVSCSFGTSVCANLVGTSNDPPIRTPAVNHFCDPNGQPIYMVWLRNGTTFFNSIVGSYNRSDTSKDDNDDDDNDNNHFESILREVVTAPADCGGLIALPFMDDEPGLEVHEGGTAMIMGWNSTNNTAGNACKAALLSTMFNLKKGTGILQTAGIATTELILSGGLAKTPECGQILADVFNLPVRLLDGSKADEGCAWGAAVLAKYRLLNFVKEDSVAAATSNCASRKAPAPITDDSKMSGSDNYHHNPKHWQEFISTIISEQQQQLADGDDDNTDSMDIDEGTTTTATANSTTEAKQQQQQQHRSFQPNPERVPIYNQMYERYQKLLGLQPHLQGATASMSAVATANPPT